MTVDDQIAEITGSLAAYVMREERVTWRAHDMRPQSDGLWCEYTAAIRRRIRVQALARQWGHGFTP